MDYIIEVDVEKLKPHPINETIYEDNELQLEDLIKSIEINGLLEPIVIDNKNIDQYSQDLVNVYLKKIDLHHMEKYSKF